MIKQHFPFISVYDFHVKIKSGIHPRKAENTEFLQHILNAWLLFWMWYHFVLIEWIHIDRIFFLAISLSAFYCSCSRFHWVQNDIGFLRCVSSKFIVLCIIFLTFQLKRKGKADLFPTLPVGFHVSTEASLGFVATSLSAGVLLSLMKKSD